MDKGMGHALGEFADGSSWYAASYGFQAAGTRLEKGDDGNLMTFYKDKYEVLNLWWNNLMQLYGLGSQESRKQLREKTWRVLVYS